MDSLYRDLEDRFGSLPFRSEIFWNMRDFEFWAGLGA